MTKLLVIVVVFGAGDAVEVVSAGNVNAGGVPDATIVLVGHGVAPVASAAVAAAAVAAAAAARGGATISDDNVKAGGVPDAIIVLTVVTAALAVTAVVSVAAAVAVAAAAGSGATVSDVAVDRGRGNDGVSNGGEGT